MRAPASLIAIPLLAGAAAGMYLFHVDRLALCAAGGAVIALGAAIALCADGVDHECCAAVIVGALLAGVSLGADGARQAYAPPILDWFASRQPDGPIALEGVLRDDAAAGPFGVTLVLDVARIVAGDGEGGRRVATRGGVRLIVTGTLAPSHMGEWRAGREVRVTALLREAAVYLNPGVPDARRSLARRGIALVGSVKSAALVAVMARGSPLAEAAAASRAWVRRTLSDHVGSWGMRSAAIATAILIGDRTGLSDDDERRLQQAGTYHVIAISGGNIAILTILLLWGLRLIGAGPRLASACVIVALVGYGELAGPAASVQRAILAAVCYLSGRLIDHKAGGLNILAVVATSVIAAAPVTVTDPGFVLSFGATLGILLCVPVLLSLAPAFTSPPMRAAAALLSATIAAETALAPVGAMLFSRVTFAGLLLNFAAIPLMTLVQIGSMVVLAVAALDRGAATAIGCVVHLAATWLVESARLVDIAPWLSVTVPPPRWWVLTGYYAAAVWTLASTRCRRRAASTMVLALLMMLTGPGARHDVARRPPGWLRIVFLDVGQADATLVRFPDGRAYLVDAGGIPAAPPIDHAESGTAGFDVGERVVAPALRAFGVFTLDTFVLTHPDPDHIGGARSIVRAFSPRAIWEGVPVPPHPARQALAADADAAGLEWREVQSGERVRIAGVEVRVLHPPRPEWERQRVRNDDSVVLELRMGDVAIVLPGDVGREGEQAALRHLRRAPLVVLKAAHHGSATSSTAELLDALAPSLVIFSAGRSNRFGHPAPSVVARHRARGATMFSTAEDGAVIVDTDGKSVHVRGWTGRQVRFEAGSRQR